MSILADLKSIFNPVKSYSSGKVIKIEKGRALVSTMSGRVDCSIDILSTLAPDDSVHIVEGKVVGKLRDEAKLRKYYI